MNNGVFLDTVGLIALFNRDDEYHAQADRLFREIGRAGRPVISTSLVLAEVGNSFAETALREDVGWLIRELHATPSATVVYPNEEDFRAGMNLYLHCEGEQWGFADCISFEVMRAQGVTEALTADPQFEQAGFRCLLASC